MQVSPAELTGQQPQSVKAVALPSRPTVRASEHQEKLPPAQAQKATRVTDNPLAQFPPQCWSTAESVLTLLDVLTALRQFALRSANQEVTDTVHVNNNRTLLYQKQIFKGLEEIAAAEKREHDLDIVEDLVGAVIQIVEDVIAGAATGGPVGALVGLGMGVTSEGLELLLSKGGPLHNAAERLYKHIDGSKWLPKSSLMKLFGAVFDIVVGSALEAVDPAEGTLLLKSGMQDALCVLKAIVERVGTEVTDNQVPWKSISGKLKNIVRLSPNGLTDAIRDLPIVHRPIQA